MSDHVSAIQAANILGCSESLIRKRIQSGELPATKRGKRWYILRTDLDGQAPPHSTALVPQPSIPVPHSTSPASEPTAPVPHSTAPASEPTAPVPHSTALVPHASEWRDDLLAQVARLEAYQAESAAREETLRSEADRRETEAARREERSKARIIDLERELTVRDSRVADVETAHAAEVSDLRGQVAVLEAKVRETLEAHTEKLGDLASDIAELANAKAQMELRVYELEPVANQVPALQAAVEEKDASLSDRERELELREHELNNVREDIEAIASRPVTGSVFRLLTKKRLRI
jgi:excisionase family DNA binding protein